jgi:MFS family permease
MPSRTSTPSSDLTAALARPRAVVAAAVLFAVNGLVLGGYAGVLPSMRERIGLSATQIAVMLFCLGLSGIASMQVGGRLSDAVGARKVALSSLPFMVVAAVTFAFATTYPVALLGALVLGLGNGAMDVAMNVLGVQVEAARRRPVMSTLHALWSVGGLLGAACVLLLATVLGAHGAAIVMPLMLMLAAAAAVVLLVALRITPEAAILEHTVDGVRTRIPRIAWLLAVMALAFGLSEGTAIDWSALHVTDVAGVDSTTGALGLVAMSGFMIVIRLLGDRLVARFGRRAVVCCGGLCAAAGYTMVTVVSSMPLLLCGWALVGLGVGMIAPQVYAVAGHVGGGRVLAVVVTFGYAAALMGPAAIGFLVNHLGLHHAMVGPAVLCAVLAVLAVLMPRTDDDLAPTHRQEG